MSSSIVNEADKTNFDENSLIEEINVSQITRALISVSDKTGIITLAQKLVVSNVEIISTGNTHKLLLENNIQSKSIDQYTGQPEILDGRVKTLDRKILAGILANPSLHVQEMSEFDIKPIDLVIVNLYPFEKYTSSITPESLTIENIDIGGITLIRAAAKNFLNVAVLTSPDDYPTFDITKVTLKYRKNMAQKAFALSCTYDSTISNWFQKDQNTPDTLSIAKAKSIELKYGENPHQAAAFYGDLPFEQIQGRHLGYNNMLDINSALAILEEFHDDILTAIIKHTTPCGVAIGINEYDSYTKALQCDPISSFGGIVGINGRVDSKLAKQMIILFTEVIIANDFSDGALEVFSEKPNLRILKKHKHPQDTNKLMFTSIFNGIIAQDADMLLVDKLECVTDIHPSATQTQDLLFAYKVCKFVKSNAIVVAIGLKTLGIGCGQTSRVASAELALAKSVKGAVMASDGFFPFEDSIDLAHKHGIQSIIQPGGSRRDTVVIKTCNKYDVSMMFTNLRHFKH